MKVAMIPNGRAELAAMPKGQREAVCYYTKACRFDHLQGMELAAIVKCRRSNHRIIANNRCRLQWIKTYVGSRFSAPVKAINASPLTAF